MAQSIQHQVQESLTSGVINNSRLLSTALQVYGMASVTTRYLRARDFRSQKIFRSRGFDKRSPPLSDISNEIALSRPKCPPLIPFLYESHQLGETSSPRKHTREKKLMQHHQEQMITYYIVHNFQVIPLTTPRFGIPDSKPRAPQTSYTGEVKPWNFLISMEMSYNHLPLRISGSSRNQFATKAREA